MIRPENTKEAPKNVTRYWWDRHTPGLSLMCADFTTREYPSHTHEALIIAVTEGGGSIIKSRGLVEEAHASFSIRRNHMPGGWDGGKRWSYRSHYLTESALDALAQGLGIEAVSYFTRNKFSDTDLIGGLLQLHRAIEVGRDVFRKRELFHSTC